MLDLNALDVDAIASALADQMDYEHRCLIDPGTGEVVLWTSDTGIDGENPVELDELDLIVIDPLPSHVWYQDMVDFADGLSDDNARRRLGASLQGKEAFRRFRGQLYDGHPQLASVWHAFRDARAHRRAVEWLQAEGLIGVDEAQRILSENPSPTSRNGDPTSRPLRDPPCSGIVTAPNGGLTRTCSSHT